MGYTYTLGQRQEPITRDEARAHLRVDFDDDDAYIESLITAVRWKFERTYRRALLAQTLVLSLDWFGMPDRDGMPGLSPAFGSVDRSGSNINVIDLRPPVSSITSVKYYDPSGNFLTLSDTTYGLDNGVEPNRLFTLIGKIWPATMARPNAVQITFVAGHTDPSQIPGDIKQAMLMTIANFYENREEAVIGTRLVAIPLTDGVKELMSNYKFWLVR